MHYKMTPDKPCSTPNCPNDIWDQDTYCVYCQPKAGMKTTNELKIGDLIEDIHGARTLIQSNKPTTIVGCDGHTVWEFRDEDGMGYRASAADTWKIIS